MLVSKCPTAPLVRRNRRTNAPRGSRYQSETGREVRQASEIRASMSVVFDRGRASFVAEYVRCVNAIILKIPLIRR
jgi:hypothetical protein